MRQNQLWEAVKISDIQTAMRLLKMEVNINGRDKHGVCVMSYSVCVRC